MAARYGHLINKWTVAAVAGLALMAVLLAAALPAWAQDLPPQVVSPTTTFDYAENGTGPIISYSARDPEGNRVFWTLGGPDAADFTIDGGTLPLQESPDYENPTDRADADHVPPAVVGNNTYRVTVRSGAGGEDGDPDPADDYDGDDVGEVKVTVNVTNVNELGMVVISPMQPQVGTRLTPTLTDLDGPTSEGEWQWARSDSMSGPWEDIPQLSNQRMYRPTIADQGKYLRVTVMYVDRAGADTRTVRQVSTYPVREDIVTSNDPPKYPDQTTLGETAGADGFARGTTERFITENSPAGTNVGAPVTAFDDETAVETVTYSLRDTTPDSGHASSFNIHAKTGQITVSPSADLNAEATTPEVTVYAVTVQAIDPDGDTEDIAVTIRVVGVNEPPSIAPTSLGAAPANNVWWMGTEISHYESDRNDRNRTTLDTNLDTDGVTADLDEARYTATDPDTGDTITWKVEGPDGDKFNITEPDPADGTATLAFKKGPDFETKGDANNDNVYQVTIVVTDSAGNTDQMDVTVKVINSTEDNKPGKVTIMNRAPEVATELVAEHDDDDGGVRGLKWQWYRAATAGGDSRTRCTGYDPLADDNDDGVPDGDPRFFIDGTDGGPDGGAAWEPIDGATSASYTRRMYLMTTTRRPTNQT